MLGAFDADGAEQRLVAEHLAAYAAARRSFVRGWWVTQDAAFQQYYSNQFAVVMAQEIVNGTTE